MFGLLPAASVRAPENSANDVAERLGDPLPDCDGPTNRFLCLSRLFPAKGFCGFLAVLERLGERGGGIEIRLAGAVQWGATRPPDGRRAQS